jgi:hypothetical protein
LPQKNRYKENNRAEAHRPKKEVNFVNLMIAGRMVFLFDNAHAKRLGFDMSPVE